MSMTATGAIVSTRNSKQKSRNLKLNLLMLLALVLFIIWAIIWTYPGAAKDVDWDVPYWVTITPAEDCSQGCWDLYSFKWVDYPESGGNINIYTTMALTSTQHPVSDLPWHTYWPDGNVRILTKAPPDVSDFPMYGGCFDPDIESGPFSIYAGDHQDMSVTVSGMGLPQCQHVIYIAKFIWQEAPLQTPTPTPTRIPPNYWLYLPLIHN